jgi:hypothetical protein
VVVADRHRDLLVHERADWVVLAEVDGRIRRGRCEPRGVIAGNIRYEEAVSGCQLVQDPAPEGSRVCARGAARGVRLAHRVVSPSLEDAANWKIAMSSGTVGDEGELGERLTAPVGRA